MKLYNRKDCPFCWKVNIYLSEIDQKVDEVMVELGKTHPDVELLNPNATVPVLVNGNMILTQSAIIIEYLSDKFPAKSLLAGSSEQRARIRQLHHYSDTAVGKILFPFIKAVRESNDPEGIELLQQSVAEDWDCLQRTLSEELADNEFFVSGFSVAECALVPRIALAIGYGLTLSKAYQNLKKWFELCITRPSFQRTMPEGFLHIDEMVKKSKLDV